MNSSHTEVGPITSPWRTRAWAMSAGAHLVLVLLLAWMLRAKTEAATKEIERPVAIVLAQRGTEGKTVYTSQSIETNQPQELDPLPQSAELDSLTENNVDLPNLANTAVANANDGLVHTPTLDIARPSRRLSSGRDDSDVLANDPIRNRPPPPPGEPVEVSPFGARATGRSFVFLIDRSQSMGALGALSAAEAELTEALGLLDDVHRFQIIAYNRTLDYFQRPQMTTANSQNKELAGRFLNGLIAASGTEHRRAILAGLRQQPDVIFLLTDGGDPPLSTGQARQIARDNTNRTSIHCIHFTATAPQNEAEGLQLLARLNGGNYRLIDASKLNRRRSNRQ